jgi:hypothetical protein
MATAHMRKEKSMEEHTKSEEPLREEFLEGITGSGGILSLLRPSNNFRDCVECQVRTQAFERHVSLHDRYIASVNHMEGLGHTAMVDRSQLYGKAIQRRDNAESMVDQHLSHCIMIQYGSISS